MKIYNALRILLESVRRDWYNRIKTVGPSGPVRVENGAKKAEKRKFPLSGGAGDAGS